MIQYGRKLIRKRQTFVEELNEIICDIHKNLTGGEELLQVIYEPSAQEEDFEELLFRNRDRDIRMKMTSSGPHRDDLCFLVNGIDIRKYGSQGQQRTAALSLKLSEIYLVKKKSEIRLCFFWMMYFQSWTAAVRRIFWTVSMIFRH